MTRPPLRLRDRARHQIQQYAAEDRLEEVTRVDPETVPGEARRRDLGIPDGLWFTLVMGVGLISGLALASVATPVLGEDLARGLVFGPAVSLGTFAYRRWGHRQFRWGRAVRDGVIAIPIGFIIGLAHALLHVLF
jgi:hypothetical protein